MLEEDHQLGGGGGVLEVEEEEEEEVLQGLLLCSMCRNHHCSKYVITSRWFVVYVLGHVWPGHDLGMWCLYFGVLNCDRDMRNLMWFLSTLALWCKYYAYILSGLSSCHACKILYFDIYPKYVLSFVQNKWTISLYIKIRLILGSFMSRVFLSFQHVLNTVNSPSRNRGKWKL